MKKSLFITTLLFLMIVNNVLGQCMADAGSNVVVCVGIDGMMDSTVQIGGNPIATGGTPPYTIAWETYHQWIIGQYTITYTASDILNDTTIANPKIINDPGTPLHFTLTVTDANGIICTDSVLVQFSNFGTHLGYSTHYIHPGDSVHLDLANVFGGIPPVQYLWRPNHGLTDSTSLSPWANPTTSVNYYITATDSAGCTSTGSPVHQVIVSPVLVNSIDKKSKIQLFPNPTSDFLNIRIESSSNEPTTIELIDVNGLVIKSLTTSEKNVRWNLKRLAKGSYTCRLSNKSNLIKNQTIIID